MKTLFCTAILAMAVIFSNVHALPIAADATEFSIQRNATSFCDSAECFQSAESWSDMERIAFQPGPQLVPEIIFENDQVSIFRRPGWINKSCATGPLNAFSARQGCQLTDDRHVSVPEPGTSELMLIGILLLGAARLRGRRRLRRPVI